MSDTMVPITSDVGPMTPEELRAFRDEYDLTRAQVAVLLSVAPGTVRNWEQSSKGARRMPAPAALLLRRTTKRDIDRVKREHPPKRRARRQPGQESAE